MPKPLFTPSHVANFILQKAKQEGLMVTQLKLLKLVYLVYGWVRAVLDQRLFDEDIQAWRLGPVTPSLYHEFKRFKDTSITDYSLYMDEEGQTTIPFIPQDHPVVPIMQKAWDVYKPFTAFALVNKTHEPDSPWAKHYNPEAEHQVIPDFEIKDYFLRKIGEYVRAASQ